MSFYINADKISLNVLRKKIEETDLIPSRSTLLDNLEINFDKLKKANISNLSDLRREMKTSKKLNYYQNFRELTMII